MIDNQMNHNKKFVKQADDNEMNYFDSMDPSNQEVLEQFIHFRTLNDINKSFGLKLTEEQRMAVSVSQS